MKISITEYICIDCAVKNGLRIPADPYVSIVYINGKKYFTGNKNKVKCSFCGKETTFYYMRTILEEI